jgi:hypothetical protein
MRGAVDPPGEARNNDRSLLAQVIGKLASEPARRGGRIPGAHNRDERPLEQLEITLHRQQWRRIVQLGKVTRVQAEPQD